VKKRALQVHQGQFEGCLIVDDDQHNNNFNFGMNIKNIRTT